MEWERDDLKHNSGNSESHAKEKNPLHLVVNQPIEITNSQK